jgi:hypothetical protein
MDKALDKQVRNTIANHFGALQYCDAAALYDFVLPEPELLPSIGRVLDLFYSSTSDTFPAFLKDIQYDYLPALRDQLHFVFTERYYAESEDLYADMLRKWYDAYLLELQMQWKNTTAVRLESYHHMLDMILDRSHADWFRSVNMMNRLSSQETSLGIFPNIRPYIRSSDMDASTAFLRLARFYDGDQIESMTDETVMMMSRSWTDSRSSVFQSIALSEDRDVRRAFGTVVNDNADHIVKILDLGEEEFSHIVATTPINVIIENLHMHDYDGLGSTE